MKQFVPFYALASGQADDTGLEQYARLIRRKQRDYERETKPFTEMEQDAGIAQFLDDFTVYDNENEEWIYLNNTEARPEPRSSEALSSVTVGTGWWQDAGRHLHRPVSDGASGRS